MVIGDFVICCPPSLKLRRGKLVICNFKSPTTNNQFMQILGIESSCDETAAAIIKISGSLTSGFKIKVESQVVWSQIAVHKQYGGVVPEVAAREHLKAVLPVVKKALSQNKTVDLIAVTCGPGLLPALAVGFNTAQAISYFLNKPMVGVNHLEGHLWSFLLNSEKKTKPLLPAVGLIVSGGHTELVLVKGIGKYQLLGQTRDDAVGEAFDKVAKMLGLGYPGGPLISNLAKGVKDSEAIIFPQPMLSSGDLDFSFSGLKTAVKYYLQENFKDFTKCSKEDKARIAAGFQKAVIEILTAKTITAVKQTKAKAVFLGGGVSANFALGNWLTKNLPEGVKLFKPKPKFTSDNAVMIALAGYFNQKKGKVAGKAKSGDVNPNLSLARVSRIV